MENTATRQSLFADMNTGARTRQAADGISPRATRYGFSPVWQIDGLPSTAFKLHSFPASKFVPFRVFEFPVTNDKNQQEFRERTPSEQVADLEIIGAGLCTTDFPELAALENEQEARTILEILTNSENCPKYGLKLKNTCVTCWHSYLLNTAPNLIVEAFEGNDRLYFAAGETYTRLFNSIDSAITEANRQVDVALRQVDDPKSGKDSFKDVDYINLWHTHKDMPKQRTIVDEKTEMNELAKAISLLAKNQLTTPTQGLTSDDVKQMISEANNSKDAEIARLKQQLAEAQSGKKK